MVVKGLLGSRTLREYLSPLGIRNKCVPLDSAHLILQNKWLLMWPKIKPGTHVLAALSFNLL